MNDRGLTRSLYVFDITLVLVRDIFHTDLFHTDLFHVGLPVTRPVPSGGIVTASNPGGRRDGFRNLPLPEAGMPARGASVVAGHEFGRPGRLDDRLTGGELDQVWLDVQDR
ncbi:hypothetical protein GCM10017600_60910 [Streptosporangium carneum]|uniref:Uncharacterized protein n=1 Tax=Streptosporangium carneum TaxID=47481 RepID=A0A9W6I777_9ACTN|nr:hypothetical protein GCM10017600_60910 [Streptosporangium carneum]